jgi:hypothetical protein
MQSLVDQGRMNSAAFGLDLGSQIETGKGASLVYSSSLAVDLGSLVLTDIERKNTSTN